MKHTLETRLKIVMHTHVTQKPATCFNDVEKNEMSLQWNLLVLKQD